MNGVLAELSRPRSFCLHNVGTAEDTVRYEKSQLVIVGHPGSRSRRRVSWAGIPSWEYGAEEKV